MCCLQRAEMRVSGQDVGTRVLCIYVYVHVPLVG